MGCALRKKTKPNKKFISSLRTISMNAEQMLAEEIHRDQIKEKLKRARTKLKLIYHLKKNKDSKIV